MKNKNVTLQRLLDFAKSISGTTLQTKARHNKFYFYVDAKGFHYIPESTKKPRLQQNQTIERVIERFNQNGSLHPSDYVDLTVDASYLLVIIEKYVNSPGRE